MFITEDEMKDRLESSNNLLNRLKETPKDETKEKITELEKALQETEQNPTFPSENDAVRLAILAGRRHLRPTAERGGRYAQQGNVPPIFRSLIGAAARVGSVKHTAREWGISEVTAQNYKHGRLAAISQGARPESSLVEQIENQTLGIRNQVLEVLAFTVSGITPESVENKDPKELSIIARNLASIMQSTKPPADIGDKTTNAQVIVFSPEQDKTDTYDTVEIG